MADIIGMCQRTADAAGRVIADVRRDEYGKSTPCSEWDVKALISHMIGGNYYLAGALVGQKPDPSVPMSDLIGNDAGAAYAAASKTFMDAGRQPGTLERMVDLGFATVPGSAAVGILLSDQLVHTWDLSKASGRDTTLDPELAAAAFELMKQMASPEMRAPGGAFGPEVPCPDDAPVQDRLIAFCGRQP